MPNGISIHEQCGILLAIRLSLYCRPLGESLENLKIMELVNKHETTLPNQGVLSMMNMLAGKGWGGCSERRGTGHCIKKNT